ncbi:pyrimidine 5'-nucleotidase [Pokkaliibacter sp. CJK22405]|uniref:pyrimidine 5'-nucleotidase n=1 Tax=Pokkaliibacter sp. CJK22405 TaxID=3384615 RepID=UPI003984B82F
MSYQWVIFDADDTLFHFDAFAGLQMTLATHGKDFNREDYAQYQAINTPLWQQYQQGEITAEDVKIRRFIPLAEELGISPRQLNQQFLASMAEVCHPLEGVRELLERLQGKVGLGIITNGLVDLQTARLARNAMSHFFEVLVVSEAVGVAKPDPKIFRHTELEVQKIKPNQSLTPEQFLMVGDNPASDILGGQRAGWHTCWLNAAKTPAPDGILPNYTVSNHFELKRLLEEKISI